MNKQEMESIRKSITDLNTILQAGYIYIMVNPGWRDKVKIGYADDLEKRRRDFSGTGFPDPSHVYAAYGVSERLEDKEIHALIDGLNPDLRYASNKEFYVMTPEHAYSILERIAKVSGTLGLLKKNPLNDAWFNDGSIGGLNPEMSEQNNSTCRSSRQDFWVKFNKYLDSIGSPFSFRGKMAEESWSESWKSVPTKTYGWKCHIGLNLLKNQNKIVVCYWMHDNKDIYDKLFTKRVELEKLAGMTFDWDRKDGKKAACISTDIPGLDFSNTSNYPALMKETVDKVVKMKDALESLDDVGK